MIDQMREEFEAWAPIKHSHFLYPFNRVDGTDRYVHSEVQQDWAVWKASRASIPAGYTAVDMTSAETASYRGLAEHLIERLATAYPDSETTMTVECFADWLSKEFRR